MFLPPVLEKLLEPPRARLPRRLESL